MFVNEKKQTSWKIEKNVACITLDNKVTKTALSVFLYYVLGSQTHLLLMLIYQNRLIDRIIEITFK